MGSGFISGAGGLVEIHFYLYHQARAAKDHLTLAQVGSRGLYNLHSRASELRTGEGVLLGGSKGSSPCIHNPDSGLKITPQSGKLNGFGRCSRS